MFNPLDLMGKLKEMQSEMERARQRLDEIKITVDADLMDRNDKEIMEDLIAAAVNKAMEAAENVAREEIGRVSNNFMPNIPGMDMSQFGRYA